MNPLHQITESFLYDLVENNLSHVEMSRKYGIEYEIFLALFINHLLDIFIKYTRQV